MAQNLSITFKASDFPAAEGRPAGERANAAAKAFAAEVSRLTPGGCFPHHVHDFSDGSIVVVYEPYPYVGDLEAKPMGGPGGDSTGVIALYGSQAMRTEFQSFYPAAQGHAVHAVDVLAPAYLAERAGKRR